MLVFVVVFRVWVVCFVRLFVGDRGGVVFWLVFYTL